MLIEILTIYLFVTKLIFSPQSENNLAESFCAMSKSDTVSPMIYFVINFMNAYIL